MCVFNGYGAVSNPRQDLFSMLSVCEIRSEKVDSIQFHAQVKYILNSCLRKQILVNYKNIYFDIKKNKLRKYNHK